MGTIVSAGERLGRASDLAGVLDAAYQAFESMLPVVEAGEDPARPAFAAYVLAGTEVALGRDAVAAAPSLPAAGSKDMTVVGNAGADLDAESMAVARLSGVLAGRLEEAAAQAFTTADREACVHAAEHAVRIADLLGGSAHG